MDMRGSLSLPFAASTPATARAELDRFLHLQDCDPETVDHALIVVSELIANAVQHGRPDPKGNMRIDWRIDDCVLTVSVWDAGEATARMAAGEVSIDAQSGRGLAMVHSVADKWSVDRSHGTRVSVELLIA